MDVVSMTPPYLVRFDKISGDKMKMVKTLDLPDETEVDTVIRYPSIHDLHVKGGAPWPILSVIEGRIVKEPNSRTHQKETFWCPFRFDYGIGNTDLICIEECVINLSPRSDSRYAEDAQYVTNDLSAGIAVNTGVMSCILGKLNQAARYTLELEKGDSVVNYTWHTVKVASGMPYKVLPAERASTESATSTAALNDLGDVLRYAWNLFASSVLYKILADFFESTEKPVPLTNLTGHSLSTLEKQYRGVVKCNAFFTMGYSVKSVGGARPADNKTIRATGSLTMELCGCHIISRLAPVEPPSGTRKKFA